MNKLIPLSEYVLQEQNKIVDHLDKEMSDGNDIRAILNFSKKVRNYTKFLRQPLTLAMFVPADENGNVLTEPDSDNYADGIVYYEELNKYIEAKEKVLFENDWKLTRYNDWNFLESEKHCLSFYPLVNYDLKVENIINLQLPLTPSALKLIGEKE